MKAVRLKPSEELTSFGRYSPEGYDHLPTAARQRSISATASACQSSPQWVFSGLAQLYKALGLFATLLGAAKAWMVALFQTTSCISWMSANTFVLDFHHWIVDHGIWSHWSDAYKTCSKSVERATKHATLDLRPSWATIELLDSHRHCHWSQCLQCVQCLQCLQCRTLVPGQLQALALQCHCSRPSGWRIDWPQSAVHPMSSRSPVALGEHPLPSRAVAATQHKHLRPPPLAQLWRPSAPSIALQPNHLGSSKSDTFPQPQPSQPLNVIHPGSWPPWSQCLHKC